VAFSWLYFETKAIGSANHIFYSVSGDGFQIKADLRTDIKRILPMFS